MQKTVLEKQIYGMLKFRVSLCVSQVFHQMLLRYTKIIRKATIRDAARIKELINECAKDGSLLPLGIFEVYDSLRDFILYEMDSHVVGVCSLRIIWEDLAEVRSLAVDQAYRGMEIGSQMVEYEISEAVHLEIERVFTLTTSPVFFSKLGFDEIDKGSLPHKIWHDCVKCVKFPNCDEVAMIKKV